MSADFSDLLVPGEWEHRFVSAGGSRFHVACSEAARPPGQPGEPAADDGPGDRPLVMLLNSFPQCWYQWRHQIPAIAAAGHPVAALDLRGFGASDKPPHGYDVPSLTRDVAGVIRSLGYREAVVIGHGIGGIVAWSMPAMQPAVTVAIAAIAAPHPAFLHITPVKALGERSRKRRMALHLPGFVEGRLRGEAVSQILRRGSPDHRWSPESINLYRTAMRIPSATRSSLETMRWLDRPSTPSSLRYRATVRTAINVPALQLQGTADPYVSARNAPIDSAALCFDFRFETLAGAGHFLPEERSDEVTRIVCEWLSQVSAAGHS